MLLWIVENTLVAGIIAAVIAVICRFNRGRPAFCHLLWLLALCALVAPPLPLTFNPGEPLRQRVTGWLLPKVAVVSAEPAPLLASAALPVSGSLPPNTAAPVRSEAGDAARPPAEAGPVSAALRRLSSIPLATWALLLWLAGACVVLTRQQVRVLSFHRRVRRASPAERPLRRSVAAVARRLGVRPPEVRLIQGVGAPSVWCYGRPRLLWPAAEKGVRTSSCNLSLIAHEMAHLARKDHWVSRFEALAMGLVWWNPLFWIIRAQIHYYSELSCDAWALWAFPDDRRAYAEALIDAQQKVAAAPVVLQGLGATDQEFRQFERRLSMIMQTKVSRGVSKGAAALAILATVLVIPGFSGEEKKAKFKAEQSKAEAGCSGVATLATSKKLMQQAEKLYSAKQVGEAVELYQKVLSVDPGNGLAHGRLGYILSGQGEYAKAKKHYECQLSLGHQPETALYNLACVAALAGDDASAMELLQQSVRRGFSNDSLMPQDDDLASLRGAAAFDETVKLCTESAMLKKALGKAKQSGDKKELLGAMSDLVRVTSEDGALLQEYGLLLLKVGKAEGAVKAFHRQAEVGFNTPTALYNLACAHARSGDPEAAIQSLEKSVKHGMAFAGVLTDEDLSSLEGDPRFEELKQRLAEPEIRRKKIKQSMSAGNFEAAAAALEEMAKGKGVSSDLQGWASFELAEVLRKSNQNEDAIRSYEQAVHANFAVDQAAFGIAAAHAALGDKQAALTHLQHALDLGFADPDLLQKALTNWDLCADAPEGAMEKMVQRAQKQAGKKSDELKKKKLQKAKEQGLKTF